MVHLRTEANVVDKLLLVPLLVKVLVTVFYRLVTYSFATIKANTPLKDVIFAGLRAFLGSISAAQEQWIIAKNTESRYVDFAKKQGFRAESTYLNSGAKLHWLAPKDSSKVLVYFHGGGYTFPCSPGHIQWLYDLQQVLSKKASVSVVLVSYTLAPEERYPRQLQQAAEVLKWLLDKQNRKPSDIVIGGDSAGGNLTLSLLSHLLHPHPEAVKIDLEEPLAAALLLSPWIKFSTEDKSWTRNSTSDMLHKKAVKRWASHFLGGISSDEYSEPGSRANTKWFSGLNKVVKDVLVWGGGGEVLIDSIRQMGQVLKEVHPKTQIVVQAKAAHVDLIVDTGLGSRRKAEGTKLVEGWLADRI